MAIDIDSPIGTVANPVSLGPLQWIHGTCSGPNPTTTEIALQLVYTDASGTHPLLSSLSKGLNGGNSWYIQLGRIDQYVVFGHPLDTLPPIGAPLAVQLGFAAPPYTGWAVNSTLTGRFVWDPHGAWWNAIFDTFGAGILQQVLSSVRKKY